MLTHNPSKFPLFFKKNFFVEIMRSNIDKQSRYFLGNGRNFQDRSKFQGTNLHFVIKLLKVSADIVQISDTYFQGLYMGSHHVFFSLYSLLFVFILMLFQLEKLWKKMQNSTERSFLTYF